MKQLLLLLRQQNIQARATLPRVLYLSSGIAGLQKDKKSGSGPASKGTCHLSESRPRYNHKMGELVWRLGVDRQGFSNRIKMG